MWHQGKWELIAIGLHGGQGGDIKIEKSDVDVLEKEIENNYSN